jgi:hypothetical protein
MPNSTELRFVIQTLTVNSDHSALRFFSRRLGLRARPRLPPHRLQAEAIVFRPP